MRNVYMLASVAIFLAAGCVNSKRLAPFDEGAERIVIYSDGKKLIARIGEDNLDASDCSTSQLRCINISNKFAFIYPRKCPLGASYKSLKWEAGGFGTFFLDPYPEIGLPSGVYMTSLSDKVSYDYDIKRGLTRIIVSNLPASDRNHNRGDYERSFTVTFPKKDFNKFACD